MELFTLELIMSLQQQIAHLPSWLVNPSLPLYQHMIEQGFDT